MAVASTVSCATSRPATVSRRPAPEEVTVNGHRVMARAAEALPAQALARLRTK